MKQEDAISRLLEMGTYITYLTAKHLGLDVHEQTDAVWASKDTLNHMYITDGGDEVKELLAMIIALHALVSRSFTPRSSNTQNLFSTTK